MEKIQVGFELAQIDLQMRGQGEIFGLKQSGFDSLKIADLSDQKLISSVQTEAKELIKSDPSLKNHSLLKQKLARIQTEMIEPN